MRRFWLQELLVGPYPIFPVHCLLMGYLHRITWTPQKLLRNLVSAPVVVDQHANFIHNIAVYHLMVNIVDVMV